MSKLSKKKCIPCEGGMPPLTRQDAEEMLKELDQWMLVDEAKMLAKSFRFKNFVEAMKFVNEVARIAESEGHHPDITISYNVVGLELMTHAIDGLSENDFILASKVDQIKL
ncbi:hypothetical protein A2943_01915 [Candidatus Adlerbacteria bacterium RIFCSPLOWO2_01_FULL_51_16]|uniref:Putative pterin-4-alpha-carbinolamine dehydratase n=1 Tax=Candidatus Adlerbacteria bacterium RIFCSPLOWO2_01_FULL_51_16 TaxID=1797243 RepID=A0A1F4XGP5_9BACT|nr:MAG: hypothetical protein A2943_01915 [Candidatus Adlerbacteria bacterium RIFCSPLOWO2_01_FULL_51_16]